MKTQKFQNIVLSLLLITLLTCILLWQSGHSKLRYSIVSSIFFWVKAISIVAVFIAAVLVGLRLFRVIDPERNFMYTLTATTNTILGLGGVGFYLLGKINVIGLHDLLLNLLIGTILLSDLFYLNSALISDRNAKGPKS